MRTIFLDVDTGVDDTLAILYAALHPDIEIAGVGAVWGNVEVETAARNSAHALVLAGAADVPVAVGAAGPSNGDAAVYAHHVHGDDGQGNAGDPSFTGGATWDGDAADLLVSLARERPGELALVATGPLTNVALALERSPELPDLLSDMTVMGGAAYAPGNITPVAEANVHCDPEAAAAVFAAPWKLTVVGLDVTMRELLDESHLARLAAGGPEGRYAAQILPFYFDFFADAAFGERLSCMHDAIAVAVAAGTLGLREAPLVHAEVDATKGPGRGQTIFDLRGRYRGYPSQEGARCRVVLEVEGGFGDRLVDLIAAGSQNADG